jgi:archaeal flagellar protein FlaI
MQSEEIDKNDNLVESKTQQEKIIEEYIVTADNVDVNVNIIENPSENVYIYRLNNYILGKGTQIMLDYIMEMMTSKTSIKTLDNSSVEKINQSKNEFRLIAINYIKDLFPSMDSNKINLLSGLILQKLYGFDSMEYIMNDNHLEEVCINSSKEPISVYHKKYGWVKTDIYLKDDEQVYNYTSMIGRKAGKDINNLNPIMDAPLSSGDRVAATLFPISSAGSTLTIRRFSRTPWTITHLVSPKYNVMSYEIAAIVWQALEFELNVMVAGGTASGKTSVLNAFCALMPKNQRILSIEDTREFILPKDLHWNWVPLSSRPANAEGEGRVSMLDLTVASLRMRPDRIIVGEVRKSEQAQTMFEAMHTGHSVYTTMHADTVEQIVRRLIEPPISVPKNEVEALQLIIIQHRDRRRNIRRTLELAEVLHGSTSEDSLALNYLYRWRPRDDTFEKIEDSNRIMEDINLRTGMNLDDIQNDLNIRIEILKWFVKFELFDTDTVGRMMKIYYKNPLDLLNYARKDINPFDIKA